MRQEFADQQKRVRENRWLIEQQQQKLEAGKVDEEKAQKRIEAYARREADALAKAQAAEAAIQALEQSECIQPPEQ